LGLFGLLSIKMKRLWLIKPRSPRVWCCNV